MPTTAEISTALRGAYRLLIFDAAGLKSFDISIDGFWRSFFAAFLVAPLYFAGVVIQRDLALALAETTGLADGATLPSLRETLFAEAIAYPLSWIAFPIVMIGLARFLKLTGRYVGYIIAYNWSSVVVAALQLFPLVLFSAGVFSAKTIAAPIFLFVMIALTYRWFIARIALGVSASLALALVFIDVLISLLLARAIGFLLT